MFQPYNSPSSSFKDNTSIFLGYVLKYFDVSKGFVN